jgi:hypothetical protein
MQKPKWLKQIENHFPERVANTTNKLKNYAQDLGKTIYEKSATICSTGITKYDIASERIEKLVEKLHEEGLV